ncbi:hypothetical protein PF003_g37142 [Phytophthora fragariae]|nr:hypothetical protein PF003_g37142 [Phytophthora fragariae]
MIVECRTKGDPRRVMSRWREYQLRRFPTDLLLGSDWRTTSRSRAQDRDDEPISSHDAQSGEIFFTE